MKVLIVSNEPAEIAVLTDRYPDATVIDAVQTWEQLVPYDLIIGKLPVSLVAGLRGNQVYLDIQHVDNDIKTVEYVVVPVTDTDQFWTQICYYGVVL